jgi:adenosylhomocysteine nucleosidase
MTLMSMSTILVITPLAVEHSALRAANLSRDFHLQVGGHGKVQFALSTQLLIQKYKPGLVICAGAAGVLRPDLEPLDIVVGEMTIEHDFKLRFARRPLPRFAGDPATLALLKCRSWHTSYKIHFGGLASGDEDIVDAERAAQIHAETDALAVAWEGAGGARAAHLHGIPFIEIRVLTDGANAAAAQDFVQNVKQGMLHVAEVLRVLI